MPGLSSAASNFLTRRVDYWPSYVGIIDFGCVHRTMQRPGYSPFRKKGLSVYQLELIIAKLSRSLWVCSCVMVDFGLCLMMGWYILVVWELSALGMSFFMGWSDGAKSSYLWDSLLRTTKSSFLNLSSKHLPLIVERAIEVLNLWMHVYN